MKHFKKAVIPSLLALLLAMSSCSSGVNDTPETTVNESKVTEDITETVEAETEEELKADFEDIRYDGRSFTVWTTGGGKYEIYAEEETGNAENDAIFRRNLKVEEQFDVDIAEPMVGEGGGRIAIIQNLIMSGEDFAELVSMEAYTVHSVIMKDYICNWYDVAGVNLDNPWWNTLSNDVMTVNGKLFMAAGDYDISTINNALVMFYNPVALENYGIGVQNIQSTVLEGRWTLDFLEKTVTDVYTDLNGNGERDENDFYGYMAFWSSVDPTFTVFGEHMTKKTEDGSIELSYMNEKTVDMFTRMYELIFNNTGSYPAPEDWGITRSHFTEGHVAFIAGQAAFAKLMADMEDGYGIIPYPKWNEDQDRYYVSPGEGSSLIGVPITANINDTFIWNITDALNYYSKTEVVPVVLDVLLKSRYSLDENTTQILNMFIENRVYEFAVQFSEQNGSMLNRLYFFMRDLVSKKNVDIVSAYQKSEKRFTKGLEQVLDHYK